MNHWLDMKHWMVIDGKSSKEFDMFISGGGTYLSPEKAYEEVEIPGRNGSIFLYDGNYKNVNVSYEAWIASWFHNPKVVDVNYRNLRSFLLSRKGYFRIEDTYHPDEFRIGTYNETMEPEVHQTLEAVQFTLNFNCKPQRFLKKYGSERSIASGEIFFNETYFDAKPLLRVYGTGTITVGDISVAINSADGYTDIDCEQEEAYKDTFATNCNSKITLTNSRFPVLEPGANEISYTSGITKVLMTPYLYML